MWTARGDGAALVDDLFDRCQGLHPGRQPPAWSTWEAHGQHLDAAVVARDLRGVRALAAEGLCGRALIDDGWQQAIGDWWSDPDRFPAGLAALGGSIRDSGVQAGLWTAPVLVSPPLQPAADDTSEKPGRRSKPRRTAVRVSP